MNDEERKARFAAAAVPVDFVVKTAAEPVVSSRTRVAGDFHDHATRRLHTLLDSTLDVRLSLTHTYTRTPQSPKSTLLA